MSPHILALDVAGAPHRWINVRDAAHYYATDMIAWATGTNEFVLRGGTQRSTGVQSLIRASSIIAIKGKDFIVRHFDHVPTLTKEMLLARDRYVCAYCAQRFRVRSARHGAHRAELEGWRGFLDEPRRGVQGVQQPQGESHAGSRRHEAALRAVRSEPVRGVHPEQPQDPGRPDGVPAPGRAEELAYAPDVIGEIGRRKSVSPAAIQEF